MNRRFLSSILILPGSVLVFVPSILLGLGALLGIQTRLSVPTELTFWLSLAAFFTGVLLAGWSVRLQLTSGEGTPAPWDPPRRLVIKGPYRHVRNPMISGVIFILTGEALLLKSWLIAGWMLLFTIVNLLYLPLFEEKDLENRFGQDYREYKENVPRWIPRPRPWSEDD
jgi:protein-S-isoprenylcysteine O-methyltransferase Ste14